MERSSQQKKKHDISPHAAYSSLLESCMGTLFPPETEPTRVSSNHLFFKIYLNF